ncbi:hypothetical protein Tco_1068999 [Tanacetum coccineum]|uniref:Uncharacterized protein n=1 Tax=Tanacetum coccineum TaxID=301880 RepID=A0ABQ5HJ50_9ASTR
MGPSVNRLGAGPGLDCTGAICSNYNAALDAALIPLVESQNSRSTALGMDMSNIARNQSKNVNESTEREEMGFKMKMKKDLEKMARAQGLRYNTPLIPA